ncbi:MAG: hypothetical protein ABIR84_09395 [Candidatus Nitrotoga sp.]
MASTDELDALRALLGCIQADGTHVSDAMLEEKQEAKLKKLTVSELAPGMLLLSTDEGRKRNKGSACMSPLFANDGKYDQNRACDAVLVRKGVTGFDICYIELKSDKPSGYSGQFKSTRAFMKYVVDLANTLCNLPINITRERFVVFHTDSSNAMRLGLKTKTRFNPSNANTPDAPDMFCVRNDVTVRCTTFF